MPELPRLTFTPDLVEEGSTPNCPFCHSSIEPGQEVVQCPQCASWHHAGCWEALGNRCSQLGCEGEGEIGPSPPPPLPLPPPSDPSWFDEIELTPIDPPAPDRPELLGHLVSMIELLPTDGPEVVIDIDIPVSSPAPAPAPPPVPEINCPYCHNPIDLTRPALACRVCHTPYHPDCWAASGRCSVTGCDSRRSEPYSPISSATGTLDVDIPQKKATFLSRLKAWWAKRS